MSELKADLVVLGSGPGGYSAAFRAADLGKKVILVERYSTLGGVCLRIKYFIKSHRPNMIKTE